jgi:hypothetical protein
MAKLFIITFCVAHCFALKAQLVQVKERNSGYLGMKTTIGVRTFFSPSSEPQKMSDDYVNSPNKRSLNKGILIELQRTLGSGASFSLNGGYSGTSAQMSYLNSVRFYYDQNLPGPYEPRYWLRLASGTPQIRDYFIGGNIRIFRKRKGALSPVGPYFEIGVKFHHIEVDCSSFKFESGVNNGWKFYTLNFELEDPKSSRNMQEINLAFGHTIPIKKKLLLDVSVEGGYLPLQFVNQENTLKGDIEGDVYRRMMRKQILNYRVGLAYPF